MSAAPELHFGAGSAEALHELIRDRGWRSVLLVISRSAFVQPEIRRGLPAALDSAGISYRTYRHDRTPDGLDPFTAPRGPYREPTPTVVDAIAELERSEHAGSGAWAPAEAVVAVGGGSVLDTGKALSAALKHPRPISEYLEGVGTEEPTGEKIPFVAVPTTAGTGTEATKNAVLSEVGKDGFKKSLRHDRFIPDIAVVDPLLQMLCPPLVTAAGGMDAIAQLLEAYISTSANPLTDALALDGLASAGRSFICAVERGESDVDARAGMAYAAYLSGRCLANAGLGVVHGLAGPAGAHTDAPHGAFCGILLAPATEMLVERLVRRRDSARTLGKLAAAGRVLTGHGAASTEVHIEMLLDRLSEFARVGGLPGLHSYGFTESLVRQVAREGNSKSCPVTFDEADRTELLERSL
ncbi:MAG: iron-containing alcohol dehydrogenase [Spirochaetia bacterium]